MATTPTAEPRSPSEEVHPRASLRFIGNATVLIRLGGLTLLTDPNFTHAGQRVPLGYGLHATRRLDPAMPFEALPAIDAVVSSASRRWARA